MENMIDRVARAIHRERCIQAAPCPQWEDADELLQATALCLAFAAIDAMREPSDAMVDAGWVEDQCGNGDYIVGTYQSMIDAALGKPLEPQCPKS